MDKLPAQVQRQIDDANALQARLYAQPETQPEGVAPEGEDEGSTTVETQPDAQHQEPQTQAPQEPVRAPAQQQDDEAGYWRRRFHTLEGMYNSQVPQLQQHIQHLTQAQQQLTAQLQERDKKPQQQPEQTLVTDKDREAYGQDMTDFIQRAARDVVARERTVFEQELAAVRQENAELRGQLGQTDQQIQAGEQRRFIEQLYDAHPDYDKLNNDPRFIGWLNQTDPMSGLSKLVLLRDAAERRDAGRAASIVDAFKQALGVSTPPAAPPAPAHTPAAAPAPSAQAQLQRQVAPQRTPAAQGAPIEQRMWTEQEYADAYDPRKHRGLTDDQVQQRMAEADRAVAEGRLQPNPRTQGVYL